MAAADPRRRVLLQRLALVATAGGGAWAASAAQAQDAGAAKMLTLQEMVEPLAGPTLPRADGIRLEVAALADNGHLVPVRVVVDSPMTQAAHVTAIYLLSQRNPVTRIATFHLGPWSGRAEVATRIRLAGTQQMVALARLSSGEFRMAQAEVVVTESACLDMTG